MAKKYVTFSFDDGTPNDVRLVALLDRYGIKASFHLNAGLIPLDGKIGPWDRLPLTVLAPLYGNHEVAAHSYTHPDLTKLPIEVIDQEIQSDLDALDRYFNQKTRGFAYPYGTFDEKVIAELKKTPLVYARTIRDTHRFDLPSDPYLLDPTCHLSDPRLDELADDFLSDDPKPKFFLIWGHSYELRNEEDWARFEDVLKKVSHRPDVYYGSILDCIFEMKH